MKYVANQKIDRFISRFLRMVRLGLYQFEAPELCRDFLDLLTYLMDELNGYTGYRWGELRDLFHHFRDRVLSGCVWLDCIQPAEFDKFRDFIF